MKELQKSSFAVVKERHTLSIVTYCKIRDFFDSNSKVSRTFKENGAVAANRQRRRTKSYCILVIKLIAHWMDQ